MASIERRHNRWMTRWRSPEGKNCARVFTRKVDAETFLISIEHSKRSGAYVDPAAGRVSFREYAEQWRAVQSHHRPTTAAQTETNLRRHVYPALGDRPVATIRHSDVQGAVAGWSARLSPATVEVVYRLVVRIFRAAVRDRIIAAHPCDAVRLPTTDKARVVPLTVPEVQALTEAVPPRYRALILLGAASGLRHGEAIGLTTDRVDFLRRTVTVDRQLVLVPGAPPRFGPPKTPSSHRTVPVPQFVIDALAAHIAEFGTGPDGLLFTNDEGAPIRRNRFSEVVRRSVQAGGVSRSASFHDLRHFYASLLIRHAESVKTVQARLGHAMAQETLDTYGHLWPDSEDRTRSAVEEAFSSPLGEEGAAPNHPG
jgi:integrase